MIVLAFDTAGPLGSVAVASGADVLARGVMVRQAGHAAGLIPMIEETLKDAGVGREEVSGIVVGEGPGSFTGVRVAAATAKGLSRALGAPLYAVSSLAAAALAAAPGSAFGVASVRYALFDARAERVYGACYGVAHDHVDTLVEPHAGELRDVLAGDVPAGTVFIGNSAEKHRAAIEGAGYRVEAADPERTPADGLVRFLALTADLGPVGDPGAWEPEYVRASSAERLWKI
jgi:tRNA threonylcarbamoyladenosine biosynthesis protein TsaB